ncbi:lysM and putative peptidoglycan-binding domain-containing protein 3-like [Mytilus galloprovincialis]|uniref:lysM and putative peptidoglycan-binding domain-containing protein 3-like n=1 Tax=Mytilus galloprovincialis TaxID=29158 RepID=UPI003F7B6598
MSRGYARPNDRGSLIKKNEDYPYAQVQNVKKSRVYVFGDADLEEDEIVEYEMSEMRSRNQQTKKNKQKKEPLLFDRKITDGDTLQSLSLQFGCPVAELKRVNNFITDQDFYSRRSIKIPVKQYSFLTEMLDKQKEEEEDNKITNGMTIVDETEENVGFMGSSETDNDSLHDLSDPETQRQVIRTISINDTFRSQSKEAKEFLKNMDKDLSKIRKTRGDNSSLDEVVSLLTSRRIQPFPKKPAAVNWVDCGVRWWTIVLVIIVVAILVPLVILVYYELRSKS